MTERNIASNACPRTFPMISVEPRRARDNLLSAPNPRGYATRPTLIEAGEVNDDHVACDLSWRIAGHVTSDRLVASCSWIRGVEHAWREGSTQGYGAVYTCGWL